MRRLLNLIWLLYVPTGIFAQLSPVTSQYVLNPVVINPACAGYQGALNIAAFYRNQWTGIEGAPKTMTLSVDAPLVNEKLGLGISIMNDRIGVIKETQFVSNYAYRILVGKGTLAMGLSAGVSATNAAWSDLVALDPGDDLYQVDSRTFFIPNFSFGVFYSNKNYFAGISLPKLLHFNYNPEKDKYVADYAPRRYQYLFHAGYNYQVSSQFMLQPSLMVNYQSGEKLQFDINAHCSFLDRFFAGISYRNTRSVVGIFQFKANDQLHIAYSYDFDLGYLGKYSNGSHEVMLRYAFRYNVNVPTPVNF